MKKFRIFLFVLFISFGLGSQVYAQQTTNSNQDSLKDAYAPFLELLQITPSDATVYNPPLRGCIVEAAGDLVVEPIKNAAQVTITVFDGQTVPVIVRKVRAATTAVVVCGR